MQQVLAMQSRAYLYRPHGQSSPLGPAVLLADVRPNLAVAVNSKGKNSMHGFMICCLSLLRPTCKSMSHCDMPLVALVQFP